MQKIKGLYLKYKEIINYLVFGVLTTVVSLGVKYLLLFTILDAANAFELQLSVIISWLAACIFAYITNRLWVFESKSKEIIKEMAKFFTSRLATLGLEMLIMFIFKSPDSVALFKMLSFIGANISGNSVKISIFIITHLSKFFFT